MDSFWGQSINALQTAAVDLELLQGPLAQAHEINDRVTASLVLALAGLGDEIATSVILAAMGNTERIAVLQRITAGAHESVLELLGRLQS